jgi:hypothetical protein
MRSTRTLAALALLAALAAGCTPAPKRQASWYTAAGAPADREAVRAAAKRCEPKVAAPTRGGLYHGTVEWGVAMLDCLRGEGFVLVYEDPEEISPAEGAAVPSPGAP